MTSSDLEAELRSLLSVVPILPCRLSLDTPGVRATAPMLRGVWGAALRSLDPDTYRKVFQGGGQNGAGTEATPLYVIRPAAPDPTDAPALDWLLFGAAANSGATLMEAWRLAAERGLGPQRLPFTIRQARIYTPSGSMGASADSLSRGASWPLSQAAWPAPTSSPCRLQFAAPLRILRRGALIESPTLADLTVASLRRVNALMPPSGRPQLAELKPRLLEAAKETPSSPWHGERLDLQRWSGRQHKELSLRGVAGWLDLPQGAGATAPLLAAAQWTHIGKATTVGLGQLHPTPLAADAG